MVELYIVLALVTAALSGISIVIDKAVVTQHVEDNPTVVIAGSVVMFGVALAVAAVRPVEFHLAPWLFGAFFLTGLLYSAPLYLYFRAIRVSDASMVSTLISLEAVAMPVFAFAFLNESLTPTGYFGVGLVVLGALLASVSRSEVRRISFNAGVGLAVSAVLLWAAQDTVLNYALDHTEFWTAFFWTRFFGLATILSFLYRSQTRVELVALVREFRAKRTGYIVLANGLDGIAMLSVTIAYSLGPMSIVSPVAATYPLFVLVYAGLAHCSGYGEAVEQGVTPIAIARKVLAAGLVIGGIVLVS